MLMGGVCGPEPGGAGGVRENSAAAPGGGAGPGFRNGRAGLWPGTLFDGLAVVFKLAFVRTIKLPFE